MLTRSQILEQGKIRDAAWVTHLQERGLLKVDGRSLTESTFTIFKSIIRIISEVYESTWDIQFEGDEQLGIDILGIYILFEDITITNRDGLSHNIKDLLVCLHLKNLNNNVYVCDIYGARLTLTYAEWQSSYMHSHLPGGGADISHTFPSFSRFCKGSGEINIYMQNLRGDGFTEDEFYRFAVQLLSLVNYESIEGVPHRRMANISNRPSTGSYYYYQEYYSQNFYRTYVEHFKSPGRSLPLELVIENGRYVLVENEAFKRSYEEVPLSPQNMRNYLCSENSGIYYRYGDVVGFNPPPINNTIFIFRNQEKTLQITEVPNLEAQAEIEYILYPKIVEYLKKQLEYEFNKTAIRQSTINRYSNKISNARESIESNTVPVPADI